MKFFLFFISIYVFQFSYSQHYECLSINDSEFSYQSCDGIKLKLDKYTRDFPIIYSMKSFKHSDDAYKFETKFFNIHNNSDKFTLITRVIPKECFTINNSFEFKLLDYKTKLYSSGSCEDIRLANQYREAVYNKILHNNHPEVSEFISPSDENEIKQINQSKSYWRRKNEIEDSIKNAKMQIKENKLAKEKKYIEDYQKSEFSKISGGEYLFAIYKNDYKKVRELDKVYTKHITDDLERMNKDVRKTLFWHMEAKYLSMLNLVILEYMHNYKKNPKSCFKDGAMSFTYNKTTEEFQLVDGYGWSHGTYGGDLLTGHYLVNSKFIEICKKKAGVRNLTQNFASRNHPLAKGVERLRLNFKCDSLEIEQFENNLISVYMRYSESAKK
ncbi:hypothetical protein AAFN75_16590 [Algibacter sp. AS12]|uniref:hypothetical protein n=1 Tax=Algibacter sp. AS12 TaxID=3135773 RepID=UPI00398A5F76